MWTMQTCRQIMVMDYHKKVDKGINCNSDN